MPSGVSVLHIIRFSVQSETTKLRGCRNSISHRKKDCDAETGADIAKIFCESQGVESCQESGASTVRNTDALTGLLESLSTVMSEPETIPTVG